MNNRQRDDFKNAILPVGYSIPDWAPVIVPTGTTLKGQHCELVRLQAHHATSLYQSFVADHTPNDWVYLPYGPFDTEEDFQLWIDQQASLQDPFFYAIIDKTSDLTVGIASYLRLDPTVGCIEVGHIHFSPCLQRSPLATEAMYLMMKQIFELGYRRYEWKCDALNARSRSAALRLGFEFEGIFRQATIYKGRNRDTAWFSILDSNWPPLEKAFAAWLSKENFDESGNQRKSLLQCRS